MLAMYVIILVMKFIVSATAVQQEHIFILVVQYSL